MAVNSTVSDTPVGAFEIAVIGAGNIGRTLGAKWMTADHAVVYGVRSPGAPNTASVADAVAPAEVVLRSRARRRRRCFRRSARRSRARS